MKRSIVWVALAGAAVLLAGCGSSTPGTAAPASSTAAPVSSSDSAVTSSSDTGSSVSSDTSSSETSSSDTESSSSSETESSATGPTKTIGDNSGSLDEQSTKWFDTFCTGVAPLKNLTDIGSSVTGSDPKAAQAKVVEIFTTVGSAFSSTAAKLKDVPPPTFPGGAEFATKAVPALETFGSVLTDAAKKAAAVDVAKDPAGLATALSGLEGSMSQVSGALDNMDFTPGTTKAIAAIPSCKQIPGIGG